MVGIADQIEALLRARAERVAGIQRDIGSWSSTDDLLTELGYAVEELRAHPKTPAAVRDRLGAIRIDELQAAVARTVGQLELLKSRFSRDTVNLGVSGAARVGKSTLLQTLSGLDDEQIPTGSGIPVTAVRSHIHHSPVLRRAVLRRHTVRTFLDEVVAPYHRALKLDRQPVTIDEFRAWDYPNPDPGTPAPAGEVEIRVRLRDMRDALWSFEEDLVGGERVLDDLAELRPFVAYPTSEELESGEPPARRYLAVRTVRIDCKFPHSDVDHLAIVDLPGLGELAAGAEDRHVEGLRDQVDFVLMVKRPVEGLAYWGDRDRRTLELLDDARGFVRDRGDFVHLVVNSGDTDPKLASDLRADVRRQVNDGVDGRYLTVYDADAASSKSVAEDLLSPLLHRMAERLPLMDAQVVAGTAESSAELAGRIRSVLQDIGTALGLVRHLTGAAAEQLDLRTAQLRRDLAGDLWAYVESLADLARPDQDDVLYVAAVEGAYQAVADWIATGFGVGHEQWCLQAVEVMRRDAACGPFAAEEFNRVRVEVSRRFALLDDFFTKRLEKTWSEVAAILGGRLNGMFAGVEGANALRRFRTALLDATEPCPGIASTVENLLDVRMDYRTHLYPRVHQELDALRYEVRNAFNQPEAQIVVQPGEQGAEELFKFLGERSRQVAHRVRQSLLGEVVTPALLVYTVTAQFDDALIRSGDSAREFQRLTRSYRDEIWPEVFAEIDDDNNRVARIVRLRTEIDDRLSMIGVAP